jgi:hypothetical protein
MKTAPHDGNVRRLGEQGLQGWRNHVASAAAPPIARMTPFEERDVRALVGFAFVVLSASYLGTTLARFLRGK